MRKLVWLPILLVPFSLPAQKRPFDSAALLSLNRIGDPQLSPDGQTIAFSVSVPDLPENKAVHSVWSVPLAGGTPRKLADAADRPRWSPDGKRIFYTGTSGGSSQIWSMNADGSGATQITRLSTEASGETVSPDGKYLVVTSEVYPECGADDACNASRIEAERNNKVKARVITTLLYRHWTSWQGATRSHILSVSLVDGKVVDLTPGYTVAPPFSLGGPDDYTISPDSSEVCFTMNSDPMPAVSTNSDLFVVPIGGGVAHKITGNPAADNSPQYSPDGHYIAYRSQSRPGFESDKWRLVVLERSTGKLALPLDAVDRSVESFTWAPDSKRLFFGVVDRGRQAIQFVAVEGGTLGTAVSGGNMLDDVRFTSDGKTMIFTRQSGSSPVEICKATSGGTAIALTHLNDDLLGRYELTALEDFWTPVADNTQIQSFIVKPPAFDPTKKYPVLMLIHGGPQGEWGESWTYRWNAQVFAGAGYVVVMPNPRGSFGYGQKFTDDINQDWGGKPYDDLMAVTDAVAKLP